MKITIIVAADLNNSIGVNGKLPWHLPQDLRFFKNTTWGMPVIMGRKTYDSMGKPLQGRTNIVLTSKKDWQAQGILQASTPEGAIDLAKTLETQEIFVIGGGTIYSFFLPLSNRIYLTRVYTQLAEADTWFPEIKATEWKLQWDRPFKADDKHTFDYSFQCWERIEP